MTDENARATPQTARANRTLAARAAADLAGDTLTAIYDALRPADGMPTLSQVTEYRAASAALIHTLHDAIALTENEQEQNR